MAQVVPENIQLRTFGTGEVWIEFVGAPRPIRHGIRLATLASALAGALLLTPWCLLLLLTLLFAEARPCLVVQRGWLTYGARLFGLFLRQGAVPMLGIREIRVDEETHARWGILFGCADDHQFEGRGRNFHDRYLVLNESVGGTKIPLNLEPDACRWLADYLNYLRGLLRPGSLLRV